MLVPPIIGGDRQQGADSDWRRETFSAALVWERFATLDFCADEAVAVLIYFYMFAYYSNTVNVEYRVLRIRKK